MDKTLVFSVTCDKCDSKNRKIFKEAESSKILKILVSLRIWMSTKRIYNYLKKMDDENERQEFRPKNIDKKNYFIE